MPRSAPLPVGVVVPDGFTVASGFLGDPEAWCYWDDEYPDEGSIGPFASAREAADAAALDAGEMADG